MESAYGFFAGDAWTRNVAYGTGNRCLARVHRGNGRPDRAFASQEKGFALKEDSLEILQTVIRIVRCRRGMLGAEAVRRSHRAGIVPARTDHEVSPGNQS